MWAWNGKLQLSITVRIRTACRNMRAEWPGRQDGIRSVHVGESKGDGRADDSGKTVLCLSAESRVAEIFPWLVSLEES